jgi:hypothetical protein
MLSTCIRLPLLLIVAAFFFASSARAEALATQGIGLQSCQKIAAELKPQDGLNNALNLMMYAWAQGYVSAANVSMLVHKNEATDMRLLDDAKVLDMIAEYCRANPNDKPIGALDRYLASAPKVQGPQQASAQAASQPTTAAAPAAKQSRDLNIVNRTGYPIKFIGVNPPGDEVWNENELKGAMAEGANVRVSFVSTDKGCRWNIKVTWQDDNTSSIFRGIDVCKVTTVTLRYNKRTDQASYTTE